MEKSESKNSYRSILKGTSLLGGVQVFQIGINLIRGKFVAMFLGPAGMGVSSLFNTAAQTLQQFCGLGLNVAIIKEVAAHQEHDTFGAVMTVIRRLIFLTALLGCAVCVVLAGPLSRLTFGSDAYRWQFMLLGAAVFFGIAAQGYSAVLQGMHALRLVSTTTLTGALTGLVVGVPLYWVWGVYGIVPAMVILTLSMTVASFIGVRKAVKVPKVDFSRQLHNPIVKRLIMMGVILAASEAIGTGCNYLVNLFIRTLGALDDVGLYQAANSVTNQYSGVVFTAMMMDFFPRLSEAAGDNRKVGLLVNRQFEIVSLIACPLICLLVLTSPIVISILLTEEFLPIVPLMRWMGIGVLVKALMYPLGCIALSKDNRKLYFWLEGIFCNFLTLALSCTGYWLFGLIGLGVSLLVDCLLCLGIYYVVNHRLYTFSFTGAAAREGGFALILGGACFAFSLIEDFRLSYILMTAVTVAAIARSAATLRRKTR